MKKFVLGAAVYPHPPIIIKEIGRGREKEAQKTIDGVVKLSEEIRGLSPETLVIVSPHGTAFRDAVSILGEKTLRGSFSNFGHGEIYYEYNNDIELVNEIILEADKRNIPIVEINSKTAEQYNVTDELDHGALVPLYFLSKAIDDINIVSITYGFLSGEELFRFGEVIANAVENTNRRTILIASGDLSHRLTQDGPYPYSEKGQVFDDEIVRLIEEKDFEGIINFDKKISEPAGECGLRCFQIMSGFLSDLDLNSEVFSYEGPFGVGYATALLKVSSEDRLISLAKDSLEYYIKNREKMPVSQSLPKDLLEAKSGCFVTLKKDGELRGCIGTISPTKDSLAEEIIENAVSAGIYDPRFYEVSEEELKDIKYSVDVLYPPEQISSKEELDVKEYGVIVSSNGRRGLLLPNLEGINTVDEQIRIALLKAGINPDEDYSLERFKVIRHE